jgi:hypothetical protein
MTKKECLGPLCRRRGGITCADDECDIASGVYDPATMDPPMSDTPERIALRWEPGAAVTSGPLMEHPDYTMWVREDVAEAAVAAAVQAERARCAAIADKEAVVTDDDRYWGLSETEEAAKKMARAIAAAIRAGGA